MTEGLMQSYIGTLGGSPKTPLLLTA